MALSYFDRMGAGMGAIVDRWLGIDDNWKGDKLPRFQNRTSYLRLLANPPPGLDGTELARTLLERITETWIARQAIQMRHPSSENWRFNKQLDVNEDNPNQETILERQISAVTGVDWANQIPTTSGLLDSRGRHCNVDLVHHEDNAYSLFELKCMTNTPLYAAIEILVYGLVYLFSRLNAGALDYNVQAKPILDATAIHLRVLAPREYYPVNNGQLGWLERPLSDGVSKVATARTEGRLSMDFRFEAFPAGFNCNAIGEDLVNALNARTGI